MTEVTLIGERLAEPGREFVYHGPADACTGCPYRSQCLNLTEGRRYRITARREHAQRLPCGAHEDDVVAVEVAPAELTVNVPTARAMAGNKTGLAGPCPHFDCPSHSFCEPDGLQLDEEQHIMEVLGEPPHDVCHLGRDLTMVEMRPDG